MDGNDLALTYVLTGVVVFFGIALFATWRAREIKRYFDFFSLVQNERQFESLKPTLSLQSGNDPEKGSQVVMLWQWPYGSVVSWDCVERQFVLTQRQNAMSMVDTFTIMCPGRLGFFEAQLRNMLYSELVHTSITVISAEP